MTNIFHDLDNLSTNDLRVELALINNINLSGMAKQTGSRVAGALAKLTSDIIAGVTQKENVLTYEVTQMSDMVRKNYDELAGIPREELKSGIRGLLVARCESSLAGEVHISDEKASYMIISEAARMYGVPRHATLSNKIHEIGIYYNKDLIQAVHEMVRNQTKQEAQEFDDRLQKRLDIISLESKRELSKRLFPKEFSGRGLANVFRLEKGTKYLETAVSIMGIECFDYMTAYSVAAQRSLRTFNSMRRAVAAQFVWKVYGIKEEDRQKLPSYVNTLKAPEVIARENEFRQILKNRIEADKEIERLKTRIDRMGQDEDKMLARLNASQDSYSKAREEFENLEQQKDTYMSGVRPEAETKRFYSQVNSAKRRMDATDSDVESAQKKYNDLIVQKNELESTIKEKEINAQKMKSQTNAQLIEVTASIRRRWNEFFTRIIFADDVYGQAVLAFSRDELLCVEQALLEFMELNDKTAHDAQPGVICVNVSDASVGRIKHDGITVTEITR